MWPPAQCREYVIYYLWCNHDDLTEEHETIKKKVSGNLWFNVKQRKKKTKNGYKKFCIMRGGNQKALHTNSMMLFIEPNQGGADNSFFVLFFIIFYFALIATSVPLAKNAKLSSKIFTFDRFFYFTCQLHPGVQSVLWEHATCNNTHHHHLLMARSKFLSSIGNLSPPLYFFVWVCVCWRVFDHHRRLHTCATYWDKQQSWQ